MKNCAEELFLYRAILEMVFIKYVYVVSGAAKIIVLERIVINMFQKRTELCVFLFFSEMLILIMFINSTMKQTNCFST